MEKWVEVYKGTIPEGTYTVELKNGDEKGLIIRLESRNAMVTIEFGLVSAVRMLEEGIILQGLFNDNELNKYKSDNFKNIIYKITNGNFEKSVRKISGEIYDVLEMAQYLIVTLNYVIEVISQTEPQIKVFPFAETEK